MSEHRKAYARAVARAHEAIRALKSGEYGAEARLFAAATDARSASWRVVAST